MGNSADIRRENKKAIYRLMLDGNPYTKQQVAQAAHLSQATCNTLLNDMVKQGVVQEEGRRMGEVGRSSILYRICPEHESYLGIHFVVEQGRKYVETILFSAAGAILFREKRAYETVDYARVETIIADIAARTPNLAQILVGTPSIAEHGVIRHCDIPELEQEPMTEKLERRFGLPVAMENDMHHKAYGYCKKANLEKDVVTLGYFPSHILPGTVTIHKGMIIRGVNSFAGMTGFLPYDVDREEQLRLLAPDTCVPLIAKAICSIIALLNPGTIVLTGDLICGDVMEKVAAECERRLPREYLPRFLRVDSFDEYYYEGMFQLAVDKKAL